MALPFGVAKELTRLENSISLSVSRSCWSGFFFIGSRVDLAESSPKMLNSAKLLLLFAFLPATSVYVNREKQIYLSTVSNLSEID